jgi:Endonuclease/Exonuclease/phosphatase family
MQKIILLAIALFSFVSLQAQDKKAEYKVAAIGFYNCENLYDTLDQENVKDEEFLPRGKKNYTSAVYLDKLNHLSDVISQLGKEVTPDGLAIMGMAEIENESVIQDLVNRPKLIDRGYKIIHYDSPDLRGVDVAMIYQPKYFTPIYSAPITMHLTNSDGSPKFTRDILYVKGLLDGDTIHVMVNHWPSRLGGAAASAPGRNAVAQVCKNISDSLMRVNPEAKIMVMGDLNDDPVNASCAEVMGAKAEKKDVYAGQFYNPMYKFYKAGIGTLAYDDAWNLFDQIMISYGTLNEKNGGYHYYKTRIFNETFLTTKSGAFKGYPHRTYIGDRYDGGYSDHFPVYLFFVKPK